MQSYMQMKFIEVPMQCCILLFVVAIIFRVLFCDANFDAIQMKKCEMDERSSLSIASFAQMRSYDSKVLYF